MHTFIIDGIKYLPFKQRIPTKFPSDKLHFHSTDTRNSATILTHTVALLQVIKSCLKIQIVIDYIEAPPNVLQRKVAKTTDRNLHCNATSQPLQRKKK